MPSLLFIFTFFLLCFSVPAVAQTIVLNKNADMLLGSLDYAATYSGTIQLGTNGTLAIVGGVGLVSYGGGQAGSITITSPTTGIVEVKCSTAGLLKSGNKKLDLTSPEIAVNTGVPFGSGSACQGTRKSSPVAAVINLATTPSPNILIGGEIVIANGVLVSGDYSSITGGKPVDFTILFQ